MKDIEKKTIAINLPYGKEHLSVELPKERVCAVLESRLDAEPPRADGITLVREALNSPIGSPKLSELCVGKKNIVIIASDHTRPVPSKQIIPPMLDEIYLGNPEAKVTVLIATGCHRETTMAELKEKFGEQTLKRVEIKVHDCLDEDNLVKLGMLPSGGELIINKTAAEADLLISEGFIEPHFFAGFSGGRKSVLPGIASRTTVYANHCAAFIADDHSRSGILEGNPIHRDMIFAARAAKLSFIVNVVINSRKEVIGAFAGDCEKAHVEGTRFLEGLCKNTPAYADIVITTNNGYPMDQNIYQTVKGLTTAEATCNNGGVIIMAAKCEDGSGGEGFRKSMSGEEDTLTLYKTISAVPQDKTLPDQWMTQILSRILLKHTVIYVSAAPQDLIRDYRIVPATDIKDAIAKAEKILNNPNASITVIPEGISNIIESRGD